MNEPDVTRGKRGTKARDGDHDLGNEGLGCTRREESINEGLKSLGSS